MGAAEARTVLVSVSALPLRRFVLCGRPIKKPGNGVLAPRRNGQFLPQLHGHPAYRLPGARITWFIFPRHPDVAVVRYEVGRSKTEPRSAVIAPNPTYSADYGCTVCHSCAATPVEVVTMARKLVRSCGAAPVPWLVRVYNGRDPYTQCRITKDRRPCAF